MSEDKMDHQEDPKAASRRSRKDQQGRDYVCGCGKRYLSYPALYTHIKTKHDGHQPEGTQKTGVAPANRRAKPKIDDKILKQVQSLVHLQNLNILTHLDENAQGSVPLSSRVRKQQLPKQLIEAYNSLLKLTPNPSSPLLDKKSSLETVLVSYLVGAGQYTSESMYNYYCQFARLFRNCFFQYAQEIYDVCFKTQDVRKDRPINLLQCKMAPIICDFFLRYYVPYQKKDNDFQAVMELMSLDFCQWMYSHRLTIVEVTLRKAQHQIKRNLIYPGSKQRKLQQQNQKEEEQSQSENESQSDKNENENPQQMKQMLNENADELQNGDVSENGGDKLRQQNQQRIEQKEVENQNEIEQEGDEDEDDGKERNDQMREEDEENMNSQGL